MLMTMIKAALGRWQLVLAVLGVLVLTHGLTYCKGRSDGVQLERAAQLKMERKAVEKARAADAAAGSASKETSNAGEEGNDRARDAAGGVDPLGDGLRSLRGEKAGARPAPRRTGDVR